MKAHGAIVGLAFLLVAGAFAIVAQPPAAALDLTGLQGGDLRVALQGFGGLDPRTAAMADREVLELVYDQLGRVDGDTLMIVPWAAAGWTWDTDKNLTVTLRDDLAWSDGSALTASDVAWSLELYLRNNVPRWNVVVVDATTIRFDFTGINTATYNYRTTNEAGPGLFFTEALTASIAWKNLDTTSDPTGPFSGPFAVQSYTPGSALVLAANEHHFSGRPNLDTIAFQWPYTVEMIALSATVSVTADNDAACALMFRQVDLIGWSLLSNDLTNLRDCVDGFGGFFDPQSTFMRTNVMGNDDPWGTFNGTYEGWLCNQTAPNSVPIRVPANAVNMTVEITSPDARDNHDLGLWLDTNENGRCDFGVDRQVGVSNGTGATQSIFIASPLAGPYLAQVGLYSSVSNVFNIESTVPRGESLLSTAPDRLVRHIKPVKNAGPDFLYFGFTFNGNSMFTGGPGSEGQKLRSAIYWFVNKANYQNVEGGGNTRLAHSPIAYMDAPWHPASCPPWTPCDTIVDAGFKGTGAALGTNTDPGRLQLTMSGFLDRDADGFRDLSTGARIAFQVLAPAFNVDPRKTTIADDLSFLLRSFGGLETTTTFYTSQATLDAAIASCQISGSCMYIKRFTSATILPDWLYGMKEVLDAGDPTADLHLNLGAMTCFELPCRQTHVGHVGHLLGAAADFLPVLHFDALEAYDFESFDGWVDMFGGVSNFWTYVSLHRPQLGSMTARVTIVPTTTLGPGDDTDVIVSVQDDLGNPVVGATVELTRSLGSLLAMTGTTDSLGEFRTTYTAPTTVSAQEDVWIGASVAKEQYAGDDASASLTVHPAGLALLVVSVSRGPAFEIPSGNTTTITVQVQDGSLQPVANAAVSLRTNLPGATFTPSASGTTSGAGIFIATFQADVTQGMQYLIIADVSKAGYADATQQTSLVVRGDFSTPIEQINVTKNVPGFEAAYALAAVGIVSALVALGRRRREG